MHQLIDEAGLQDDIKCISTIYDSIYFLVKKDATTIKWLNDRLVPIMCKDFMEDQSVKNEATAEIGLDWADMLQIKNSASIEDIQRVINIFTVVLTVQDHLHRKLTKDERSNVESNIDQLMLCSAIDEALSIIQ